MGRNCTVCESPERQAIEVELAGGRSRRALATEYRTSPSAMRRHSVAHLEPGLHRVALGKETLRLGGLIDRLILLSDVADDVLAEALGADGDRRLALAALRESRELIAMISRLTGADSAEAVMDAERLARALAQVLPRHLDAAKALAHELGNTGSTELADAIGEMVARGAQLR